MAVFKIRFTSELLQAYHEVLSYAFESSPAMNFAHFDVEGDSDNPFPKVPQSAFDAFKTKKLKHVKMTDDAFRSFFGLWRRIELEFRDFTENKDGIELKGGSQIIFPLPKTARAVPVNVSSWNSLKPGGDTITKHIDDCQERVGVRTENNVATTRIFMYFGVVFHKFSQMISARNDLDSYPTLCHYRDAANHRTSMKKSLWQLYTILLKMTRKDDMHDNLPEMPAPVGVFAPSPAVVETSQMDFETPTAKEMPYAATKTRKSPGGRGRSLDKPHTDIVARCKRCEGFIYAKMIPPAQDARDSDDDDCIKKDNPRKRRMCSVCKRRTNYFCSGCRIWLCNEPPQNRVVTIKTKKKKKKG